ncbi:hypothetical protein K3N28_12710 [Glycomyces sp. TRM65418]|uniref:hypothetical protein n=1 Tax=Glycomyces sp. TRM65418 TaxID=2867006 RepID=UPI001CE53367|nr:hypothetical protein [Glycomyces sp. TRM65418]MCC3763926.1 hypothetical protein [Glycomyces sp. TRM65418]QZD53628.1 hypothetical protein K3N28_12640 [Glycomyces sp. TRM65418]
MSRRRALAGTALMLALVLLAPAALGVNLARFMEYRAAVDGSGGTRGTAVVEVAFLSGSGDANCKGEFRPDGGGPAVEVDIAVRGRCEEGQRLPAVLVEPAAFHPDWWGRPTAWTAGTGTAQHLTPVIMVFLLLVLPVGVAFWAARKPLWRMCKLAVGPSRT